jgi:hypothetical protein
MLLSCFEHGGAAVEGWGPLAADERYANSSTNQAYNLLVRALLIPLGRYVPHAVTHEVGTVVV